MLAMSPNSAVLRYVMQKTWLAAFVLLVLCCPALASTASEIAQIQSGTTDGSSSNSEFRFVITSEQMANALSTSSHISLTVSLTPQDDHVGLAADVFAVIVADGIFYLLNADGTYTYWDGSVANLTPFAPQTILEKSNQFSLLDGKMSAAGTYLYFSAYSVAGESRLLFTPQPAQINVATSAEAQTSASVAAAERFEDQLEIQMVQAKCIVCHVEGGLARNSSLQFQRTTVSSALYNYAALSSYVEEFSAEKLLSKATGGENHPGGVQLEPGSQELQTLSALAEEIESAANQIYYTFNSEDADNTSSETNFLTEVTLEPREATLRRATILLQGRIPTPAETASVSTDAALKTALRQLMQGPAFREFVVNGVNDRLLTESTGEPVNIALSNFVNLHNERAELNLDPDRDAGALYQKLNWAANRAAGELVAHVIEHDLPYSEILTADYMMMNPFLNYWLEGDASFAAADDDSVFKPAQVGGYYYPASLEVVEENPAMNNSIYRATDAPLAEYPHAGILSDFAFLARYPTTATNRNRARARWTFYHFLGIDIEKSSQRPTDELALTDRNNPTMNNPACTVCHALLDPVAGAFQNWSDFNFYRHNGTDTLDQFYKYPEDGTPSPYIPGDLWYRDMRAPGLFDQEITERDTTLRELAALIVSEPGFLNASAAFWWPSIIGKPLLDRPAVESDQGYADKLAAYTAQQTAIDSFAKALAQQSSAKDMLVEMLMSPWFSAESVSSYTFSAAHYESQFGSKQLLTPEQLSSKTRALTGVSWRSPIQPDGTVSSAYDTFAVLLGGIDSDAVTQRATELTATMTAILMTHATEAACPAVVRQFAVPMEQRTLFTEVSEQTQPLYLTDSAFAVNSVDETDWQSGSFDTELNTKSVKVSVNFTNPYCDWDGNQCLEQNILLVKSLSLTSPSGNRTELAGNDSRFDTTQHCYLQDGYARCYSGSVSIELTLEETGAYRIDYVVSAQQAPSLGEPVQASVLIEEAADPLRATNQSATALRRQISSLYRDLHGSSHSPESDAVTKVFEIFVAARQASADTYDGTYWGCTLWNDGLIMDELLSEEELATFRYVEPGTNWFQDDWEKRGPFENALRSDPYHNKYAWTAVMMYMLSHYDYLHE